VVAYRKQTRALVQTRGNGVASFYSRALHGSNMACARREEGRWWLSAAVEREGGRALAWRRCAAATGVMKGMQRGRFCLYAGVEW
jgi:hypothetical protein